MKGGDRTADFLIIGGGVMVLNLALEARRRHPRTRVALIEKKNCCGSHASARNSGVLHAGFYYSDAELAGLEELLRRGKRNGVEVHDVTEREAREIKPRVRTRGKALYSPTTSSVDPAEVMAGLERDAWVAGIEVLTETRYLGRSKGSEETSRGRISAGYVINAGGLYVDRIARDFGFCRDYRILPFKWLHLYSSEPSGALRTHIYPVPDLEHPFLGVHCTLTVDGKIKIGPTATPPSGASTTRVFRVSGSGRRWSWCFASSACSFATTSTSARSPRKYSCSRMVRLASEFVSGVRVRDYATWGPPGIRAQLVHVCERRLEMDFRYEGDDRSFHVLNVRLPGLHLQHAVRGIPVRPDRGGQVGCMSGRLSSPVMRRLFKIPGCPYTRPFFAGKYGSRIRHKRVRCAREGTRDTVR